MLRTISLAVVSLLLSPAVMAAGLDPFVGTWRLDIKRSQYPAGTCPSSMVIEMKPAEHGVWYHSDATFHNGRDIHVQYTARYDGKQAIVAGDRGLFLPVALKRMNSHTVVASYSRGIQLVATSRRVVSSDGRLMTITTNSLNPSGKMVRTVGVYRKQ